MKIDITCNNVILPVELIQNPSMTFESLGLLSFVLSFPPDKILNYLYIQDKFFFSAEKIDEIISELFLLGYTNVFCDIEFKSSDFSTKTIFINENIETLALLESQQKSLSKFLCEKYDIHIEHCSSLSKAYDYIHKDKSDAIRHPDPYSALLPS